jgi:hypothetical protein
VRLEVGDHGEPLLQEGQVIMEVKATQMLPQWLLDYFGEYNIKKQSYSKYGNEYKKYLRRQLGIATPQDDNCASRIIKPQIITA